MGNDCVEHSGELYADLFLLVGRENVDDTVNGVGGADGMKGGEKKMSCLCGRHGNLNCLVIPHFPKKNNVRALAQGSSQSAYIIFGIHIDFTLAHHALNVSVEVFQGVFQGDDMLMLTLVNLVNHTG